MSGECIETINVICKHVEDSDTYYCDFAPRLGYGETLSSVTSITASDSNLTVGNAAVLGSATTTSVTVRDLQGNTTTVTYVIAANKGVSFTMAGGSSGAGCSAVTIVAVKSTGKTTAVDVKVEVHGEDA